jgi:hypothetical protein
MNGPRHPKVFLCNPGTLEGPDGEFYQVQPDGVCEVNLADFPNSITGGDFVGFFAFHPGPELRFDVTCRIEAWS